MRVQSKKIPYPQIFPQSDHKVKSSDDVDDMVADYKG